MNIILTRSEYKELRGQKNQRIASTNLVIIRVDNTINKVEVEA